MTLDELTGQVKKLDVKPYLQKARKSGYICPHCDSGTGTNGTGAVKYYPDTGTASCHACGKKVDAIDLYMKQTGSSFAEAVRQLAADAGAQTKTRHILLKAKDVREVDCRQYYRRCIEELKTSEPAQVYLRQRGISLETAVAHGIGFDAEADPASAPAADAGAYKPHPAPRIIIPTSATHYVGRSIDPTTEAAYKKLNPKGTKPDIFNKRALWDADIVFVVEGAFDALSLLEVGASAVALNSTSNVEKLLEAVQSRPTKARLMLCLDHDEAGQKAQAELAAGLDRLNVVNCAADIVGPYKDPNEHLTGNRQAFAEAVERALHQQKPDNTASYIETLMAGEISKFQQAAQKQTGFANLDKEAGGLYSGLYVLAAISSLGKTTFALQIADQLAQAGHEVIYFSMEQSRLELVTKSIARFVAQANMRTAVTSLDIRRGYLPDHVLNAAADNYKTAVADRVSIVEGNFNCTIGYIAQYTREHMKRTGTKPTVIIDYLQILQPSQDNKGSKKEDIDLAVTELKRMSRELDLTIIVISSVNRANYQTEFSFESLKESGGIEYTADVVWGLQLQCLDEPLFASEKNLNEKRKRINAAKAEEPRKIKFVCIKNRYGNSNYNCYFSYYPKNDLFVSAQAPKQAQRF